MSEWETEAEIRDPLLAAFGDWQDHDGRGVPAHLVGRRVWVLPRGWGAGQIELTPEYLASQDAAEWIWEIPGAGSIVMYRPGLPSDLPFDPDTLHALDRARRVQVNPAGPLKIGLDGV